MGIWYGKGEKHPYNTYAFGTQLGWDANTYQDDKPVTDQNNLAQDVIVANTPITLAGIIAWDGDSYNMNLSMGDVKVDWDLGASFNLQKVGFGVMVLIIQIMLCGATLRFLLFPSRPRLL